MPCCCVRVLNLCDVSVCGSLEIDKQATAPMESGVSNIYDIVLDYLQTTITLSQEQTEGDNITFDISALSENFQFKGKIYDADGNLVKITIDGDEYDCVKFKTVMNVAL